MSCVRAILLEHLPKHMPRRDGFPCPRLTYPDYPRGHDSSDSADYGLAVIMWQPPLDTYQARSKM